MARGSGQSGLTPTGPSSQPPCDTFADTGLIDCGNWSVSASWAVPSDAVSGVYIAHLVRNDTGGGQPHHVRRARRRSTSDVVLQTSDSTWQAYNTYGGNSLYTCDDPCPPGNPTAYKARVQGLLQPAVQHGGGRRRALGAVQRRGVPDDPLPRAQRLQRQLHLERRHERQPALLRHHKLFISSGHDEYWSAAQRASMEAARDAGTNLAFFSRQHGLLEDPLRPEPVRAGDAEPDADVLQGHALHRAAGPGQTFTGTWRDPRFTTAANGPKPENALSGLSFLVNAGTTRDHRPFAYKNLRLWRNTAATSLTSGQTLQLAPSTLGYEWDVDADNGFRPAGQIRLSSTTANGLEVFTDYGSTMSSKTAPRRTT